MDKQPIALISAVPFESATLEKDFEKILEKDLEKNISEESEKKAAKKTPLDIRRGRLDQLQLVITNSGVGKVNAAIATTLLARECSPSLVISFGVGGAYPGSRLQPGDLALAEKEILPDEGVMTSKGLYRPIEAIGFPLLKTRANSLPGQQNTYNTFPLEPTFTIKAQKALRNSGIDFKTGPFLTVSTGTGTNVQAQKYRKRYGAICENMEGGAVAQVCALFQIPLIEIRGISNLVENRDKRRWKIDLAVQKVQQAVLVLLHSFAKAL